MKSEKLKMKSSPLGEIDATEVSGRGNDNQLW
jgi:hypothetical protein